MDIHTKKQALEALYDTIGHTSATAPPALMRQALKEVLESLEKTGTSQAHHQKQEN